MNSFLFHNRDFFQRLSNDNDNHLGIPSGFEILKVLTHYQFVKDSKIQISRVYKAWLRVINVFFCDQIQFSSISIDVNNEKIEEIKGTIPISEEEEEGSNVELFKNIKKSHKEEIDVNNPIKINENKKRKQGVYDNPTDHSKAFFSKGVSFKDLGDDELSFEKNKPRSKSNNLERSFTLESETNSEALDLDFLRNWLQTVLENLNEHMTKKKLKNLIENKENIVFFNEDLINNEEVIYIYIIKFINYIFIFFYY